MQIIQRYHQGCFPSSFNILWLCNTERRNQFLHIILCKNELLYIPFARLTWSPTRCSRAVHCPQPPFTLPLPFPQLITLISAFYEKTVFPCNYTLPKAFFGLGLFTKMTGNCPGYFCEFLVFSNRQKWLGKFPVLSVSGHLLVWPVIAVFIPTDDWYYSHKICICCKNAGKAAGY